MTDLVDTADSPQPGAVRSAAEPARSRGVRSLAARYIEAWALPLVTVGIGTFFSLWSKTSDIFLTTANMQVLLGSQTVTAAVALGALIPLIAGEWDLSVGAIAGLSAIVVAQLMANGTSLLLALLAGLGIGLAVGAVNALVTTRAAVNAVITTLGMATILTGVVDQRTSGQTVVINSQWMIDFGTATWLGIPRTVYAVGAIAVIVYYLFEHTPFGRYLYALGSNPNAAILVGIRTKLVLATCFLLAGLLSAAGGFLQVARASSAAPSVGNGLALPALAAAFLSAASIKPGRYNVGGTLVALLFLAVLNNGLNLAGYPPYVNSYVNGGALIVGVALAAWLGRRHGASS